MEKAKNDYHDLQKTMQQISNKNINEKSKIERYLNYLSNPFVFICF